MTVEGRVGRLVTVLTVTFPDVVAGREVARRVDDELVGLATVPRDAEARGDTTTVPGILADDRPTTVDTVVAPAGGAAVTSTVTPEVDTTGCAEITTGVLRATSDVNPIRSAPHPDTTSTPEITPVQRIPFLILTTFLFYGMEPINACGYGAAGGPSDTGRTSCTGTPATASDTTPSP